MSVADCERDIDDVFVEAERHATPADFVIRARVERSTPERAPEAGGWAYRKVRAEVASSNCVTTRQVDLPATRNAPRERRRSRSAPSGSA